MKTGGINASQKCATASPVRSGLPNRKEGITTTVAALIILSGLVLSWGGCVSDMTFGGYQHQDLSNSTYKSLALQQAEKLANSNKPEDWRTAAKYYGSIGMLDEMDRCIYKYVEKEPEIGENLIYMGEQIHKFYKGKHQ